MKYKVLIYDDLSEVKAFFKSNGVKKYSTHAIENFHGVYGWELLGHYVFFKTADKKLITMAQRKFDHVTFEPDFKSRAYARYNRGFKRHKDHYAPPSHNVIDIPF